MPCSPAAADRLQQILDGRRVVPPATMSRAQWNFKVDLRTTEQAVTVKDSRSGGVLVSSRAVSKESFALRIPPNTGQRQALLDQIGELERRKADCDADLARAQQVHAKRAADAKIARAEVDAALKKKNAARHLASEVARLTLARDQKAAIVNAAAGGAGAGAGAGAAEDPLTVETRGAVRALRLAQLEMLGLGRRLPAVIEGVGGTARAMLAGQLDLIARRATLEAAEGVLRDATTAVTAAKSAVDKARRDVERLDKTARAAEAEWMAVKQKVPEDKEARAAFNALPSSSEEVQTAITNREAERALIIINEEDERLIKSATAQKKAAEERYNTLTAASGHLGVKLQQQRTEWVTRMRVLVASIHRAFRAGLTRIGKVGQVSLLGDETQPLTGRAGVEVKVSFRPGAPPQVLSKQNQSGGERAVTTMMLLLSLRCVSQVPFAVVSRLAAGYFSFACAAAGSPPSD